MNKDIHSAKNLTGLLNFIIQYRYLVILITAVAVFSIWKFSGPLTFANSYEIFFSKKNPDLEAFKTFQTTYSKNDNFLFVIEFRNNNVFTKENLKVVSELTEASWSLPFTKRVDSITNFQNSYGLEDNIVVEDLIDEIDNLSNRELEKKREIALNEPLLVANLITKDAAVTAVNVILQYPGNSIFEVPIAAAQARKLRNQIESKYPYVDISLSGVSMLNNAFSEAGYLDSIHLIPKMYLALLIMVFVMLRSFLLTVSSLIVVAGAAVVGMSFGALVGIKLTPISNAASIIILTLAIADTIHVLLSFQHEMQQGLAKRAAIIAAVKHNFLPVTLTSITTIVGFLALNFSDSPPYWHLGNMTAVGIFAAWFLSLFLLPAIISSFPFKTKIVLTEDQFEQILKKLSNFVIDRAKYIILCFALVSVILISCIPNIEFNDQWRTYFSEAIEFRTETEKTIKHFGMYPIEYSVPANGPEGVSDPEYLKHLERFTTFLRAQPNVEHVYSLTDIIKRLSKNLQADDESYYRIPDDKHLLQQTLLLYELSLPYGLDLTDRINVDKSASRVTVTLGETSTSDTKIFLNTTNQWISENFPQYMQTVRPTSAQVMFTYITDRNVMSMIYGILFAVLIIAVILMLVMRRIKLGLVSLLPNSLPILAAFGLWSLIDGEVGFSIAAVASISLGIIVDDTVHFLTQYVRAKSKLNYSVPQAIEYAYTNVGKAIIFNTIILSVGFFIMATSTFKINADLGLLTMITIILALIYDLFLLPAVLFLIDHRQQLYSKISAVPNKVKTASFVIGLMCLISFGPTDQSWAQEDITDKGFEVSARSDRSDVGFKDSKVSLKMVLKNAAGEEAVRSLQILTLEKEDENVGDKSLIVFKTPYGMEGTALLSHAKIDIPDMQWIYLPSIKRIKRISTKNKSGPFVGSEFAFEDFTGLELNKFDYEWNREEACETLTCDVITRYPRYKYSGYKKQIAWIDQHDFQVRKIEFYDRKDDLLKTLYFKNYKNYNGIFRPHLLEMVNHQNQKSSSLIYESYTFNQGYPGNSFEKGRLTNLR